MQRRKPRKTGRFIPPRGERLTRQRQFEARLETRSGVLVRSTYEQRCADLLYKHGVEFRYEPLMLLGGRQFRPDFYLPQHNVFLEICGYSHMPHYRRRVEDKRRVYEQHGMPAVFVVYNGRGSLEKTITGELGKIGISL